MALVYFYPEIMKLSNTQKGVIANNRKKIQDLLNQQISTGKFSWEEYKEAVFMIQTVYPELKVCRRKELLEECCYHRGALKLIELEEKKDLEFIQKSYYKLSLKPSDSRFIFNFPSIESWYRVVESNYCPDATIFLRLCRTFRRMILDNSNMILSLLKGTDVILWLFQEHGIGLATIQSKLSPILQMKLVGLDVNYRKKRNSLMQFSDHANVHVNYPWECIYERDVLRKLKRIEPGIRCYCRDCELFRFQNSCANILQLRPHHHPIYITKRSETLKSRSFLSSFLMDHFSVKIHY